MVDEFMVCVDRIIASAACFDSVNGRGTRLTSVEDDHLHQTIVVNNVNCCNVNGKSSLGSNKNGVCEEGCSSKTVSTGIRECRICQEEDEEHVLEAPCACNGTLKFAHRKCVQRWCNKKGNITCEICSQVFSPNYTLPPARSSADAMSIDIRHGWGPHSNLRDSHYPAYSTAEHQFLQSDYEDYAIANSSSVACFHYATIILMLLLLIRQALVVSKDFGTVEESSPIFHVIWVFQISLLQLAGFLLPCYAMSRSWFFLCRRRRQV